MENNTIDLSAVAELYLKAGLLVLPAARKLKAPATRDGFNAPWKHTTVIEAHDKWFLPSAEQDAIFLVAGKRSGGAEILDFDQQGRQFSAWRDIIPDALYSKLVVERFRSGGYHVGFRCAANVSKNTGLSASADGRTLIELRGDGGGAVIAPTEGYSLIQGSWENIQTISEAERETLMAAARSLTEFAPEPEPERKPLPTYSVATDGHTLDQERPGDRYNREASEATTMAVLQSAGWTFCRAMDDGSHVTRPGKDDGNGGTVFSSGVFHCFTSNGGPFKADGNYGPFQVYTIVHHNGDHKAAARTLADLYGMPKRKRNDDAEWFRDPPAAADDEVQPSPAAAPVAQPDTFPFEKLPTRIQVIASYLANETCEKVGIKHIMAAAVVIGATIGKRAEISNRGSETYLNLAVSILMPSGGNKSGMYNVVRKLVRDLIACGTPTASTIEGFLDNYCTIIPPDKRRSHDETTTLVKQALLEHQARENGNLVLVDEFRAMLLTLLPKEQSTRNSQILCRLLDRDDIVVQTSTFGSRVLGDTCFSWLGFSQTDPWNEEVRTAAFQSGGLAARIVPINDQQFNFKLVEPLPVNVTHAIAAVASLQTMISGDFTSRSKIQVVFPDDGLTKAKEWFAETANMAEKQVDEPAAVELLKSKILMQSAKLAGIFAIADLDDHSHIVDGNRWIRVAYALIGNSHLSNLDHISEVTEQGNMMEKIRKILKKKGASTQRDICKFTNLKSADVYNYLRMMTDAGEIAKGPGERAGTIKYKLR